MADDSVKLSQPRAYSLALAPQVIHTQSKLLPALVSSRIHNQLDFQAVGSWFLLESSGEQKHVVRVPSGREDIFQDSALDLKAKRSLMKFLRFVGNFEEQSETWQSHAETPFSDFLQQKFVETVCGVLLRYFSKSSQLTLTLIFVLILF